VTTQDIIELEWLRYFYDRVGEALGPASDDVYYLLKEEYQNEGWELPEAYK